MVTPVTPAITTEHHSTPRDVMPNSSFDLPFSLAPFGLPLGGQSRRQRVEMVNEGDDSPDLLIRDVVAGGILAPLAVPGKHARVSYTILHNPEQLPVRLTWWVRGEPRSGRIKSARRVVPSPGVAMAS